MDRVSRLLPVRNRPGFFVVLMRCSAHALLDGEMKLFMTPAGTVEVETITRNRKDLAIYDPGYRVVFIAVNEQGNLMLDIE